MSTSKSKGGEQPFSLNSQTQAFSSRQQITGVPIAFGEAPEAVMGSNLPPAAEAADADVVPVTVAPSPPTVPPTTSPNVEEPTTIDATPGQTSEWSSGLFDCLTDCRSDPNTTLDATFCPYCVSSAHHRRMFLNQGGIYWPLCIGLVCADGCVLCSRWCICALPCHVWMLRLHLRSRYKIGSQSGPDASLAQRAAVHGMDLLAALLCFPCSLAQHQRMMQHRGEYPGPIVFTAAAPPVPVVVMN